MRCAYARYTWCMNTGGERGSGASEQGPRDGERIVISSDNGKGSLEYERRGNQVIIHSITAGPWLLADEEEQG